MKVVIPFNLSVAIGFYTIIRVLLNSFSTFINGMDKIRIMVILTPLGIGMFFGFSILPSNLLKNVIAISIALSINRIVGLMVIPRSVKLALGTNNNSLFLQAS